MYLTVKHTNIYLYLLKLFFFSFDTKIIRLVHSWIPGSFLIYAEHHLFFLIVFNVKNKFQSASRRVFFYFTEKQVSVITGMFLFIENWYVNGHRTAIETCSS